MEKIEVGKVIYLLKIFYVLYNIFLKFAIMGICIKPVLIKLWRIKNIAFTLFFKKVTNFKCSYSYENFHHALWIESLSLILDFLGEKS